MIRRRVRVGAKARARIRAGGPTSVHRKALPIAEWRALVAHCLEREGGRCWWCRERTCRPLDPHHLVKRSLGGADTRDNVVMLGRRCHDRTDWPFSQGKLVIRSCGSEVFRGAVIWARDRATGEAKVAAWVSEWIPLTPRSALW